MKKKIILSLIALVLSSIPFTFGYISIATNNEAAFSDKMVNVALLSSFHLLFSITIVMGVLFMMIDE